MTVPGSSGESTPLVRRTWRFDVVSLVAVLAAVALVEAWILSGAGRVGWFSDSVDYLYYADFYRSILSGVGDDHARRFYESSRFPPLFPLVLALSGAGSANPRGAFVVVAVLFAAALAATWLWGRRESGRAWLGTALAFGTLFCPEVLLWQLYPLSEPLLMAIACGAFALAVRSERNAGRVLLVAALVGIAPLARMIGVALVAAGVLWLLRASTVRARTRVIALAAMVVPTIAWLAYRATLVVDEAYGAALTPDVVLARFGGWSGLLLDRPVELVRAIGALWVSASGAAALAVGAVLLVPVAVGWFARLRRNTLDGGYLPAYLAIVFIWPYPAETGRLLAALVPVLLLVAIEGATGLARGLAAAPRMRARVAAVAVLALVVGSSLPMLARITHRAVLPVETGLEAFKRTQSYFLSEGDEWSVTQLEIGARIAAAIEELPRALAPGACVYAVAPAPIQLDARVPALVYPTSLASAGDAQARLSRCDFFLVAYFSTSQHGQPPLYPLRYLESWTHPVFASFVVLREQRLLAVALMQRNGPATAAGPRTEGGTAR